MAQEKEQQSRQVLGGAERFSLKFPSMLCTSINICLPNKSTTFLFLSFSMSQIVPDPVATSWRKFSVLNDKLCDVLVV